MKVIVNTSGFYGGDWYKASKKPVEMPETIARAFLPPHGLQLEAPAPKAGRPPVKADEEKAG